jgi:hypothetical protein
MKTVALTVFLLALLAASIAGLWFVWTMGHLSVLSVHGWIALGLGVSLSIGLGAGLMALSFHSARAGYDDRADAAARGAVDEDGR